MESFPHSADGLFPASLCAPLCGSGPFQKSVWHWQQLHVVTEENAVVLTTHTTLTCVHAEVWE